MRAGRGVKVGRGVRFDVASGGSLLLGDEVVILDFDHDTADVERPVRLQGLVTAPVEIGDGAVLDATVVVLRGAAIGAGAHVTTRSVVTREVAPGVTATGVPALSTASRRCDEGR